jgi:hypothetical protein
MVNVYDVGDGIRATCAFTDLAGAAADPTAVTVKVKDPDGAVTEPLASHAGTGSYYTDITFDAEGDWYVRFEGTGSVIAATEVHLKVRDSAFY